MLKKIPFFIISIICVHQSIGQSKKYGNLECFIPKGFYFRDSASGDFNKDGNRDVILVIESKENHARPVLVLMGNSKGQFYLFARNDSVVLCEICGGLCCDPYTGITIKNRYFSIEHYGGDNNSRWTRIITFKFDEKKNDFVLHKDAKVTMDRSEVTRGYNLFNKTDFDKLPFVFYSSNK